MVQQALINGPRHEEMELRSAAPESHDLSAKLVNEIVADVRQLLRKEFALSQTEFRQEWVRAKNAFTLFMGAYIAFAFAGAMFSVALAQALGDAGFSRWVAYSLVGILMSGAGIACYLLGWRWRSAMQFGFTKPPDDRKSDAGLH